MDPRFLQFLQTASLVLLTWGGCKLLSRLHWLPVFVVALIAASNTIAIWLLRYQPHFLSHAYSRRIGKRYVDFLCRWTGDQPPVTLTSNGELQLRTDRDFLIAADRAKLVVRGHDDVLDTLLSRIRDGLALRRRRSDKTRHPPLASFLLVGGEGVGKRYLGRVLAKLLFRSGGVMTFECDRVSQDTLVGTKRSPGELSEGVRRQPFQLLVFERIDAASPELMQTVSAIVTKGRYGTIAPAVSFQNTVIVMTIDAAENLLDSLEQESRGGAARHRELSEALASATPLDKPLLNAVSAVCHCRQPTDLVKAEVVAMLMKKQSKAHGVTLSWIEPEIIASQVMQLEDASGFSLLPERISKLLLKPLVATTQQNHALLSLRVRWP